MPGMQSPTASHILVLYFVLFFYAERVDQVFLRCTVFLPVSQGAWSSYRCALSHLPGRLFEPVELRERLSKTRRLKLDHRKKLEVQCAKARKSE